MGKMKHPVHRDEKGRKAPAQSKIAKKLKGKGDGKEFDKRGGLILHGSRARPLRDWE